MEVRQARSITKRLTPVITMPGESISSSMITATTRVSPNQYAILRCPRHLIAQAEIFSSQYVTGENTRSLNGATRWVQVHGAYLEMCGMHGEE